MADFDEIIHQPLRLKIMAALNALPSAGPGLEFSRLKRLTGATDGNLGAHIETLGRAGYVAIEKAFVGRKPQTTVTATAAGRGAFARHVAMLQEIIAASARQHPE
jgi:DNA-binding MarR family transcriptional regulator